MNPIDASVTRGLAPSQPTRSTPPVERIEGARRIESPSNEASEIVLKSVGLAGPDAPVDADKVAGIRKAIEEGRYAVNPAAIADAMIAAGFVTRTER